MHRTYSNPCRLQQPVPQNFKNQSVFTRLTSATKHTRQSLEKQQINSKSQIHIHKLGLSYQLGCPYVRYLPTHNRNSCRCKCKCKNPETKIGDCTNKNKEQEKNKMKKRTRVKKDSGMMFGKVMVSNHVGSRLIAQQSGSKDNNESMINIKANQDRLIHQGRQLKSKQCIAPVCSFSHRNKHFVTCSSLKNLHTKQKSKQARRDQQNETNANRKTEYGSDKDDICEYTFGYKSNKEHVTSCKLSKLKDKLTKNIGTYTKIEQMGRNKNRKGTLTELNEGNQDILSSKNRIQRVKDKSKLLRKTNRNMILKNHQVNKQVAQHQHKSSQNAFIQPVLINVSDVDSVMATGNNHTNKTQGNIDTNNMMGNDQKGLEINQNLVQTQVQMDREQLQKERAKVQQQQRQIAMIKLQKQTICLEMEKYKNQCRMLEDQLRQTLETVKMMTSSIGHLNQSKHQHNHMRVINVQSMQDRYSVASIQANMANNSKVECGPVHAVGQYTPLPSYPVIHKQPSQGRQAQHQAGGQHQAKSNSQIKHNSGNSHAYNILVKQPYSDPDAYPFSPLNTSMHLPSKADVAHSSTNAIANNAYSNSSFHDTNTNAQGTIINMHDTNMSNNGYNNYYTNSYYNSHTNNTRSNYTQAVKVEGLNRNDTSLQTSGQAQTIRSGQKESRYTGRTDNAQNPQSEGRIIHKISPTIITSNSPRITILTKHNTSCVNGCGTYCRCPRVLNPSATLAQ